MSLEKMVCGVNYTTELIKNNINELIDSALPVNGVKSLPMIEGIFLNVVSFYSEGSMGGGYFKYDSTINKSEHNGGTILSPESLALWDGTNADISTLLDWTGTGTGTGCFVRVGSDQYPDQYQFGAVERVDQYKSIVALFNSHEKTRLVGNCHIETTLNVTKNDLYVDASDAVFTNATNNCFSFNCEDLEFIGGVFDAENKDCETMMRVESGCKSPHIHGQEFKNFNSSTHVKSFIFSEESVSDFVFKNIKGINLTATANGVVGDDTGACRLIHMQVEGADGSLVSPSNGIIEDIYGLNILTEEDADVIHLISNSTTKDFNIKIKNVYGKNVGKRLVKAQASGITVEDAYADAEGNEYPMWSVVSLYKNNSSASRVSLIGSSRCIADSEGENNKISELYGRFFGVIDHNNLGLYSTPFRIPSGSCNVDGVYSRGSNTAADIVPLNGNIGTVNIKNIDVKCKELGISIRCMSTGNGIGAVNIDGFDIESEGAFRNILVAQETGTIGDISLSNGRVLNNNYYHNLQISDADKVSIENLNVNGNGVYSQAIVLQRIRENTRIDRISTNTAPILIFTTSCDNSQITNITGASESGVYLSLGDNHIVGNVFCKGTPASPVRKDSGGFAPTNVKEFNIINMGTVVP